MRRILAVLALASAVACGGSDSVAPPSQTQGATFTGTYTLQSINGNPLPYTFGATTGDYLTIRSYSLTIAGGGSWNGTSSSIQSLGGTVIDTPNGAQSGTYTYNASTKAVSIISTDLATVFTGSVSSDLSTLTVSQNTDVYVFKK